ncbi:hypothetical protein SDC9_129859 [bioreactor metagenome]|uniref:Uncharacterized protein n=1 Tax=bioreactor metagenome TaxID=1076179 RepID=A0A645D0T6_9ZZZZ
MKDYALFKEEQLKILSKEFAEIRKGVTNEERQKKHREAISKPLNFSMEEYNYIIKEFGVDCKTEVKPCRR